MEVDVGQPVVVVMIKISVPHPVWQLGHGDGSLTVIVGVCGHLGSSHGTLISLSKRRIHSGVGPHVAALKYGQYWAAGYQKDGLETTEVTLTE